ncbi:MAG: DUF6753 family protein [Microcystaceae cyanobacterium]
MISSIHDLKGQQDLEAYPDAIALIDQALKDVDEKLKEEIFNFLVQCQVKPNDPLFVLLLACRYHHLITLNVPKEIENASDTAIVKMTGALNEQSQGMKEIAIASVESEIGKAVNRLLEKQDKPTLVKQWLNYGKYAALTLIPLILGIFGTRQYYEMSALTQFNIENQQLVGWGRSQEGKLARKIMQWNQGLVDGSCEKAVANLGVGFGDALVKNGETIGIRRATKGYCVVWRVPPNQRKFQ